ncbi:MAG TPA: DUF4276 family protein [Pyrinomonadaceae bacterium]|nr:DUF4276 family protein [Pyrinomonadaceae bacterium]
MSNIVTIGFITEGTTDVRFLGQIIRRTFEIVAFDCQGEIEVYEPEHIKSHGEFIDEVFRASQDAHKIGMNVLCIHTDADSNSDKHVIEHKINPAFENVANSENTSLCKNLVAVIPIQMTEAWMLADKDVLKNQIDTVLTDQDLEIHRQPENYADPKAAIENAIRISRRDLPRRRRYEFEISELYQIIGQTADLKKLAQLHSYQKFKNGVVEAFKKLGYLH